MKMKGYRLYLSPPQRAELEFHLSLYLKDRYKKGMNKIQKRGVVIVENIYKKLRNLKERRRCK